MKNGRCQEVFDRKVLAMKGDERGEQREGFFRDELGELVGNAVGRGSRISSDAFQGRRWKEWSISDEGAFASPEVSQRVGV